MKLHVLAVAYDRPVQMMTLCNIFLVQTNPNWELTIMYDGRPPEIVRRNMGFYTDPRIKFTHSLIRNKMFGHPNRRTMLENLQPDPLDFVLMTNDDNLYVPIFVAEMFDHVDNDTGFVMCNMLHSYRKFAFWETELKVNKIDMGAFIVRCDVAKKIGFLSTRFAADADYAEACGAYCTENGLKIAHVQNPLFIHC